MILKHITSFLHSPGTEPPGEAVENTVSAAAPPAAPEPDYSSLGTGLSLPFASPFTGTLQAITKAPDEAFAQKMTGDGFFVYPREDTVYAPCDSEVTFVFDTRHAIGLTGDNGVEYLLHIGIDTVTMDGAGFTVFVTAGQHVKKGEKLLTFDAGLIRSRGLCDACICVFTDLPESYELHLAAETDVQAGALAATLTYPKAYGLYSPCTGTLQAITEAPDPDVAQKIPGDGFLVYPEDYSLYAPCDSTVSFVFEEGHALGMVTTDGVEYVLHAGIGTARLQGEGFTVFVQDGAVVQKGDKLLTFDQPFLKSKGFSDACLCLFTDLPPDRPVHLTASGRVTAGSLVAWF